MKKNINTICGINAVLCIAAMYMPMIMVRESIFGGYAHHVGSMVYVANHVINGFAPIETIWKFLLFVLIVSSVLLIIWLYYSFIKPEQIGIKGIIASIVNLIISAYMIFSAIEAYVPLIIGIILVAFLAISAVVVAIKQKKSIN